MRKGLSGFTIVELLIVIVVIAILAAIALPTYNGIQTRAHEVAVKSDLSAIAKQFALYHTEQGMYIHDTTDSPDLNTTSPVIREALRELPIRVSTGSYRRDSTNLLYVAKTDGTQWALLAAPLGGEAWYVSESQLAPALYSSYLSSDPLYTPQIYPFPGSGFGTIARVFGIPLNQSAYWQVHHAGTGFRIWGS